MTNATRTPDARTGLPAPARAWVLVAVCLGQFLIQLDLTAVNVALPGIGRHLRAGTSELQ